MKRSSYLQKIPGSYTYLSTVPGGFSLLNYFFCLPLADIDKLLRAE